ncbi:MAG: HAMP domain-containing histidine kinase [Clostridiales bacterium]|nr:HAMP domain-containing histidine kinase [Clostridiales bacterium]
MKLIRNPEIKEQLIIYMLGTAVLCALAFFFPGFAWLFALAAGIFYIAVFLYYVNRRYREISRLSELIDRALHGSERLISEGNVEGELAILYSEICKLTLRLSEQADALRSEKLWLSSAMADISHQLRTPLTSMNLTVSMLSAGDIDAEKRIALARELKRTLSRMEWLIEVLLKLAKLDSGTARFESIRVSVAELVERSAEPLLVPMELKGIALETKIGDESFVGDLGWSSEALGNIIKNCMEHTDAGGFIRIKASQTPIFTEITVSDDGKGFLPEDIPHLFERFYKGRNSAPSSIGIGLALSRMVIASQGGTLTAKNGRNGGAEFTIKFYPLGNTSTRADI